MFETLFADEPCDELTRAREIDSKETVECEARWICGDEISGCASAKTVKASNCSRSCVSCMWRAELQAEEEDFCFRLGADDVARCFERVDGGIAAHKADESCARRRD